MIGFVPAVIKKNKNGFYVPVVCNPEVLVHPLLKSGGILLPCQMMQKNPHAIKTDTLGITQLPGDRSAVKTIRLPHFQLINGRARNKITTPQPTLPGIPAIRLFHIPYATGMLSRSGFQQTKKQKSKFDYFHIAIRKRKKDKSPTAYRQPN
jgi:hypothetical protein